MGVSQSFVWWSFFQTHTDPAALLRAAATIGYTGVEWIDPMLWPLVKRCGLRVAAVAGHASITHALHDPAQHARVHREQLDTLKLAEQHGIPNLIVFSGNRKPAGESRWVTTPVQALRDIAVQAENAGVMLMLELLNSRVDHPSYQANRTTWGVGVIQVVASPRVKLLYDADHMQIMEGDLIQTIRQHHPHFAHDHTAGNPGRYDLDDQQEIHYPAVFRAIRDTGFERLIAHEFIPNGDPVLALKRAFELCQASLGADA